MNNTTIYDEFGDDYDRFVNWNERLALEIPFLTSELVSPKRDGHQKISVIDAACGTGQHLIALKNQGFELAGADISAKMVEIARKNARDSNYEIPIKQTRFGQLDQVFGVDMFDGLTCLGNSLPHILEERALLKALKAFKAVLRTGAKLIIQNRNFDSVLNARNRWMDPQTFREGRHTWIFTRFYDFDADERITFNIMILTDQGGHKFQQRIISTRLWPLKKAQMVEFIERTGFGNIKLYGDLQGSTFNIETSGNLVITATAL